MSIYNNPVCFIVRANINEELACNGSTLQLKKQNVVESESAYGKPANDNGQHRYKRINARTISNDIPHIGPSELATG